MSALRPSLVNQDYLEAVIQLLSFDSDGEQIVIARRLGSLGELLTHEEVDSLIEHLRLYKKTFSQKEIAAHQTDGDNPADIESLVNSRKTQDLSGWIYVVNAIDLDLTKIGCSKNPDKRLKSLRKQQIPSRLEMLEKFQTQNMRKAEAAIHQKLAPHHANGEWFQLSSFSTDEILALVSYYASLHYSSGGAA